MDIKKNKKNTRTQRRCDLYTQNKYRDLLKKKKNRTVTRRG